MILVAGATGQLGGRIARGLLQDGREVRILVRHGSPHQDLIQAGAEPAFGDVKDPDSLLRACRGVRTVITTVNSAARGGADNPQTVDLDGNRALIDAARDAGVAHFIFVSALGAAEDSPLPFLRAKALSERHVRESGMEYTILVPNIFMEVWIPMIVGGAVRDGGPVTLVGEGLRRHSFVSVNDVAAFAIAAVKAPAARNATVVIGGPEAVSWRDVVAAVGRRVGREIPIRNVPAGTELPGLPPDVARLAAGLDTYDSPVDMSATASAYGVRPTTLETFVGRAFPA